MRVALVGLCSLLFVHHASAEPCAPMGLASQALQADFSVSAEGGIVVGEVPAMQQAKALSPDRSAWKIRVKGKPVTGKADTIAPGLVVYRPPPGAQSYELMDAAGKRAASAKLARGTQELLAAPPVRAVVSGESHGRHPSQFVSVELSAAPPKEAIALVLSRSKGPALSWGRVFAGGTTVSVYSTDGGCVSTFSEGTAVAQPKDVVVAFWVDASGRRSRVSPVVVVDKAP